MVHVNATRGGQAVRAGLALLCSLILAAPLMGQEHGGDPADTGEHEEHLNAVEVLLGATTETDPTSTAFTVGLGYIRRLSPLFSVGVAGEFAGSNTRREWLLFGLGYVRPVGGLSLGTGPGFELTREREEEGEVIETSNELVWRFMAAWEFEVGERYTISPEVNLDLVESEVVWVYGVAFGVNF